MFPHSMYKRLWSYLLVLLCMILYNISYIQVMYLVVCVYVCVYMKNLLQKSLGLDVSMFNFESWFFKVHLNTCDFVSMDSL